MKGQFYYIAVYIIIGTLLTLITFMETTNTGPSLVYYLTDDTLTKEAHLIQEINTGIIASNGDSSFLNDMINATKKLYASENFNITLNISVNTSQKKKKKPKYIDPSLCDYFYNCHKNCEKIAYISYDLTSAVTHRSGNYTICWRK